MKKTTFLLLLVLLQAAYGEEILTADFNVYLNDSVELNALYVGEGNPTAYVPEGDYRLVIKDKEGAAVYEQSLKINFWLYTDPPIQVDVEPVILKLPYDSSMRQLEIYTAGKLIFSHAIELCNGDGICDLGYESSLSCPEDCPKDKTDGVCVPEKDYACDPDCMKGLDPDCIAATTRTTLAVSSTAAIETTTTQAASSTTLPDEPSGGGFDWILYVFAVVAILAIAYFVYKKSDDAKIKKEREEFAKWKEEQDKKT